MVIDGWFCIFMDIVGLWIVDLEIECVGIEWVYWEMCIVDFVFWVSEVIFE